MNQPKFLVPLITPFLEDGSIDFRGLATSVRHVLGMGADGIYAVGSSAECFLLDAEERKSAAEAVVEAAEGAPVCVHVGYPGTNVALRLAEHAAKIGAASVASVPPFYFNFTFEEIRGYYADLASAGLPVIVYNFPARTQAFSLDQLCELAALPGVAAMKYTATDYYMLERIKAQTGAFVYSGSDENFLSALAAGADGAIGTTFNYMLPWYLAVREKFLAGEMSAALALQGRANGVTRELLKGKLFQKTKYLMGKEGVPVLPLSRKPHASLTPSEMRVLDGIYADVIAKGV